MHGPSNLDGREQLRVLELAVLWKRHGLSPLYYLTFLLERLPNINLDNPEPIDRLLPWSEKLPDPCKGPLKKG